MAVPRRFDIVVADSHSPRDGRFIEVLGYYHPIEKPAKVKLDEDKVFSWLEKGAKPSDTVMSLFREIGLLEKWLKKKKGEEISEIEIKSEITERTKKRKKPEKTE